MEKKKCFYLQFFAEDGQGETAGVEAADAGQEETGREAQEGRRPSWEEILADPEYRREYDRQVQGIVKKRLRDRQETEERLKKLDAAVDEICRSFGMEREADTGALVEKIRRERQEGEAAELRRAGQARDQLDSLLRQAGELRQRMPDFDLARELEDPHFLRLTAPHTGLSLEEAYYAVHHREIGERLARESLSTAVQAVRSGRERPRELRGGQSASAVGSDPRQMTKEQREDLKKRIYEARAQGRKLPYGS